MACRKARTRARPATSRSGSSRRAGTAGSEASGGMAGMAVMFPGSRSPGGGILYHFDGKAEVKEAFDFGAFETDFDIAHGQAAEGGLVVAGRFHGGESRFDGAGTAAGAADGSSEGGDGQAGVGRQVIFENARGNHERLCLVDD